MDTLMTSNQIIKIVLGLDKQDIPIKISEFINQVDKCEGFKLYNKDKLLEKYSLLDDIKSDDIKSDDIKSDDIKSDDIKSELNNNLLVEIDFNTLFKGCLDLSFIFRNDDIIIMHQNKIINMEYLVELKTILLKQLRLLGIYNYDIEILDIIVNNIIDVISKFITKDITVKYHCVNIPIPYWKLFEIKALKAQSKPIIDIEKYKKFDNIISGKNMSHESLEQILNQLANPPHLERIFFINDEDKLSDDYYCLEVMTYLNDAQTILFCEYIEHVKHLITELANNNIDDTFLLNIIYHIIESTDNKIIQFYFLNRLLKYMTLNKLIIDVLLKQNITDLINNIFHHLPVIQSTGFMLADNILLTYQKYQELNN
jgi:hypothetical protein